MQQAYELDGEDKLEIVFSKHLDFGNEKVKLVLSDHGEEAIKSLHLLPPKNARFDVSFIDLPLSNEKLLPSILQAPTLELKPLPYHLKYVFLCEKDTSYHCKRTHTFARRETYQGD